MNVLKQLSQNDKHDLVCCKALGSNTPQPQSCEEGLQTLLPGCCTTKSWTAGPETFLRQLLEYDYFSIAFAPLM